MAQGTVLPGSYRGETQGEEQPLNGRSALPLIEELGAGFFRVEVPLPLNDLQSVNSYVIRGRQRHLVVDTGLDTEGCLQALQAALVHLDVELDQTDFFLTHYHGDHFGLVHRLVGEGTRVYISEVDASMVGKLGSGAILSLMDAFSRLSGMPEAETRDMVAPEASRPFRPDQRFPFVFMREGDVLQTGEYGFRCVETPGHSAGHLCLYEPDRRLLLSGDHILGDISPGIQARSLAVNPLRDYLESLDKVERLGPHLLLPGHKAPIPDARRRIGELKRHHEERAGEVLSLLGGGAGETAYGLASSMTWNSGAQAWNDFSTLQRFFATGEALAHLVYLEAQGAVTHEQPDQQAAVCWLAA